MSFAKLDSHNRRLEAIEHAQAILGVDEAVSMPQGGGEKRAEAMAMLAGMHHELASAPQISDWIGDAEAAPLDAQQKAAIAEMKRTYINATCLSTDFVRKQVEARVKAEQLWRKLRPSGNWAEFLPAFEGVIATLREEAERRAAILRLSPYDAMIEQYDPGSRVAEIDPVFAELKSFLKTFIPQAMAAQEKRLAQHPAKPFNAPFPIARQKALGLALMQAVGFDFNHGRLDVSHHPFCGGVPTDVRMTTRYREDEFLSALMGILHETGHGLYEQGLPKAWSHWPSGRARGMAAHESQSLFVEKQIARNPAFWHYAMPLVTEHLGPLAIEGWSLADMLAHVHKIKPGLIRVDADEATYPLHVILRYEMEQDLVSGALRPRDVPEVWDAKMKDYLGLSTIDDPANGPMQDVHWPGGAIGYFPSYTLGALMAAQQWAAIKRQHPQVDDDLRRGDFTTVNAWRRDNIWQRASTLSTPELMIAATGEPLRARYFMTHLQNRYLPQA
jgi:carboxypeptidase Taq